MNLRITLITFAFVALIIMREELGQQLVAYLQLLAILVSRLWKSSIGTETTKYVPVKIPTMSSTSDQSY